MKKIIFLLLFPFFALGGEQIDLNKSSAQDLDRLTGIGPAMAQRIIEARPYSALEDLLKVKGIGEKTFAKIKEQGLACVNCRAASDLSFSQTQNKELNTPETQIKTPGQANYPDGIIFNEILPSPKGSDETDEWF
jgi:competence ComEA-like helix-hairpin-helix protein